MMTRKMFVFAVAVILGGIGFDSLAHAETYAYPAGINSAYTWTGGLLSPIQGGEIPKEIILFQPHKSQFSVDRIAGVEIDNCLVQYQDGVGALEANDYPIIKLESSPDSGQIGWLGTVFMTTPTNVPLSIAEDYAIKLARERYHGVQFLTIFMPMTKGITSGMAIGGGASIMQYLSEFTRMGSLAIAPTLGKSQAYKEIYYLLEVRAYDDGVPYEKRQETEAETKTEKTGDKNVLIGVEGEKEKISLPANEQNIPIALQASGRLHFAFAKWNVMDASVKENNLVQLEAMKNYIVKNWKTNYWFLLVASCSEPGSNEYNINLGRKRMLAAKAALTPLLLAAGLPQTEVEKRLRIATAGEEQLLYQQNAENQFCVLLPIPAYQ
jgi:hypothetical protein